MKPFEVEIFDRQFNFRLNALVDASDFKYKYDILSPEKNTINLPLSVQTRITASSGTVGDGTVCTSDYVRIRGNGEEFTGVVIKIEKNENYTVITYTDILALFDHEVYINPDDVKLSYIEDYMYKLLSEEFISTADDSQKIYGLTLTKTSQTVGAFDFSITDDAYVIINLLKDFISPAYRDFVVMTKPTIDIGNKTINVTIGRVDETNVKPVEGDLPNIIESDYVIRQANDNKNKLTLIDIYNNLYTKYNFYLHASDYSFNQTDSDRITPVVNDIEEFNSSIITEEAFWKPYNEALQTITKYNVASKTLTDGEKGLLMSAFQTVFPAFQVYARNTYNYQFYFNQIITPILTEGMGGRLSSDPDINGTYYNTYQYNRTDDELVAYTREHGTFIFTLRNWSLYNGYNYPWSSVSYRSGQEYDWLLNSHGWGWHETFLYDIENSSEYRKYDVGSHLGIDVPFNFEMSASYSNNAEESFMSAPNFGMRATARYDIPTSDISAALTAYRQSPEYQAAYQQYKTEKFAELLQAYANKIFKTSKYTNNIELTVSADDTMINPLTMPIGQVVNVIHEGVSYSSILSGKEVRGGLVKLVFGTIRLELTKILNMKGV